MTRKSSGSGISYTEINPEGQLTLVFIHGNSQDGSTFLRVMSSQKLSGLRLISMDLPGHGMSLKSSDYSIPLLVSKISEFVSELNLKQYALIGHSLGGHLVLESLNRLSPAGILLSGTPPLSIPMNQHTFLPYKKFELLYSENPQVEDLEIFMADTHSNVEDRKFSLCQYLKTDPSFRPKLLASIASGEFTNELDAWNSYKGEKIITGGEGDCLVDFHALIAFLPEVRLIPGSHNIYRDNPEGFIGLICELVIKIKMKSTEYSYA